jgi:NAD(P)-dependent dehydrogenase (short-subunit alcohol dehydrogenase family)
VVLITGASSGFGRLIAETLARKNYQVFATMRNVNGRNAAAVREIAELAERESLSLQTFELDVTDDASIESAVSEVVAKCGRVDVLVNNAGYGIMDLAESVTLAQAQRQFDTNFFGVLQMNRAVLPAMKRQGNGLLAARKQWSGTPGDSRDGLVLREQVCDGSARGSLPLRAGFAGNRLPGDRAGCVCHAHHGEARKRRRSRTQDRIW